MMDYRLLESLAAVISEQSFEQAAKKLSVTQSAISQRIKQLEDDIGQLLLIRSSPLQATEKGKALLRHHQQVKALESSLRTELEGSPVEEFQTISIAVNHDSLEYWVLDAISPMLKKHAIILNVYVDDQDETMSFLRSGEAFACISSSNAPLHGCNAIDIGEMSYHCVCTPDFKERYLKKEITKRTLIRAPGIVFSVRDDIHMEYFGQLFKSRPPLALTHIVPSTEGLKKLVLSGLAYGLLPWRIINKYVERGQLVDLFPKKTMKVPLYWHHWRLNMGMHTLLSDAVISYAKQHRL